MNINIEELKKTAHDIRLSTFKAIANAGGGHFGGSLSTIEILTVLYFDIMNIDPNNPKDEKRDYFILSKGHAGPALYTTLAKRGYFPYSELKNLDKPLSRFPKHVDRLKLSCIEVSSGPLGQGLSIACGMAIALKNDKKPNYVYILLGDGELNSGQNWEAAMTANKYNLDNMVAIVDNNNSQIDGIAEEVMPMEPLKKKWESFGWMVFESDGHDIASLVDNIRKAKSLKGKSKIIIAKTVKGCGISFMQNKAEWHSGKVDAEQYDICIKELSAKL